MPLSDCNGYVPGRPPIVTVGVPALQPVKFTTRNS